MLLNWGPALSRCFIHCLHLKYSKAFFPSSQVIRPSPPATASNPLPPPRPLPPHPIHHHHQQPSPSYNSVTARAAAAGLAAGPESGLHSVAAGNPGSILQRTESTNNRNHSTHRTASGQSPDSTSFLGQSVSLFSLSTHQSMEHDTKLSTKLRFMT